MRIRGLLLPALGLALLLLGFWWSRAGEQAPASPIDAPHPAEAKRPAIPLDSAPTLPERTEITQDAPPGENAAGTVAIYLTARGTDEPVAGEPVLVRCRDGGSPDPSWEPVPTDAEGHAAFSVPPGVELVAGTLRSFLIEGPHVERLDVSALEPGQLLRVRIRMVTIFADPFYVRLLSAETGLPLPGVGVRVVTCPSRDVALLAGQGWTSETSPVGSEGGSTESEAVTDGMGLAVLYPSTQPLLQGKTAAPGFGPVFFLLEDGHATPETALVLSLARAATLRGTVLDAAGAGCEGLAVALGTTSSALRPAEQRGDILSDPLGIQGVRWSTRTSVEGAFSLPSLPPGVPLDVEVRRDARILKRTTLTLDSGEVREVEWRLAGEATVSGLAVDRTGAPVPGLLLWLKEGTEVKWFKDQRNIHAEAHTDDDGRFAFPGLTAGPWLVGPAPTRGRRDEPSPTAPAPSPLPVTLPTDTSEVDIILPVFLGLYIEGTVVRISGGPFKFSANVEASDSHHGDHYAVTDLAGSFALGPLAPGTYELQASYSEGDAPSAPVRAQAGDTGVILSLRSGAAVTVRVVDAASGELTTASLWIWGAQNHPELAWWGTLGSARGGLFTHRGMVPGPFDFVATKRDGRIGVLRHVEVSAGDRPVEVVVTLEPGGRLAITPPSTDNRGRIVVTWRGVRVALQDFAPKGKALTVTVPAGAVQVTAHDYAAGTEYTRTVNVVAGVDTDLVFDTEDP